MELSSTWFIEGQVDFEWQQYRLLHYLQEVQRQFDGNKLYPHLSDLIFHYHNLIEFRSSKQLLSDHFPKKMEGVDLKKLEFFYEKMLQDDDLMQEIEDITGFALKKIKISIDSGAEIYELIESTTVVEPVGILPLYKDEGYVLIEQPGIADIDAYAYTVGLIELKDTRFKSIRFRFVEHFKKSLIQTFSHIKRQIIRELRALPNPAVYRIATPLSIPLQETLLPIAKRLLIRHISDQGA